MNTRTWTDEQLGAAIEVHTTWKAVARELGIAQSSTPRLQRRVRQLGLDTSHFTGKRRWSDVDLRKVIGECSTWRDVLERLDISDTTETRVRIKGYAVRLGLNIARLNGEPDGELSDEDALIRAPDLRHLRSAAESIAIAWFMLRGVAVATPTAQCTYDLLVTLAGGVQRVQVKSGTYHARQGTWKIEIGHRPYVLDRTAQKAPYDPDDLDYFFIVDGGGGLYLLPIRVVAGMTSINIGGYAEYRIGDASSLFMTASPPGHPGRSGPLVAGGVD